MKFFLSIRASVSGDANDIRWYILASKYQKDPLPSLLIVKKFIIVLLYYPKFMMVL